MENTLYYTLSTIAQTLAGALAVLVAFVLFKLADLDRAIQHAQFELQGRFGEWGEIWDILRVGGLKKFDEGHGEHQPRIRAAYHHGYLAWQLRPRILSVLSYALIGSVVDIGACFAALPWVPRLAGSDSAALVLWGAVILGIICLALYVWLIFIIVQPPEAVPPPPAAKS
jgi:hypothetical protein